jgi:hypothetical protein
VERIIRWAEIAVIAYIGVWLINKGLDAAGLSQYKA